jgi:hypothetical protein
LPESGDIWQLGRFLTRPDGLISGRLQGIGNMAKYRSVHEKIWKDPDFQKYTSNGKLVFIYLCTNSSTSESGIYAITPKTIAGETSVKIDQVVKLLGHLKNVIFDPKANYVYIRRFKLYNGGGRPDNITKAIISEFLLSATLPLWNLFVEDYPEYKDAILATGKPLTPQLPLKESTKETNSNSNSNSSASSKDRLVNLSPTVDFESNQQLPNGSPTVTQPLGKPKKPYGEFKNVLLTDEELKKLQDKFNTHLPEMIEYFSGQLESKGYKFQSHYATILNWARRDAKETHGKGKRDPRAMPERYETPEEFRTRMNKERGITNDSN